MFIRLFFVLLFSKSLKVNYFGCKRFSFPSRVSRKFLLNGVSISVVKSYLISVNQLLHFPFLFLALRILVSGHRNFITIYCPLAFFKRLFQICVYRKAAYERVAAFDININVGKGFQSCKGLIPRPREGRG